MLRLLVVVAVVGLLGLIPVAAQAGISRSLPAGPAAPGDVVVVTINNVGLADGFGDVVETLPAGFSYVEDSAASGTPNAVIDVEVSGQTVTFTVVAVESFTYEVRVGPDVADGPHTFSGGVLVKLSGEETIADSSITVQAPAVGPPAADGISRSLPTGPAAPGDVVVVTINNVGLADGFGEVVERLPAGFSYVEDSAASGTPNAVIDVEVSGQTVTFTVVAVESFTYEVRVGPDVADGTHTFSDGVLGRILSPAKVERR
jgi:hypothetical protein